MAPKCEIETRKNRHIVYFCVGLTLNFILNRCSDHSFDVKNLTGI